MVQSIKGRKADAHGLDDAPAQAALAEVLVGDTPDGHRQRRDEDLLSLFADTAQGLDARIDRWDEALPWLLGEIEKETA